LLHGGFPDHSMWIHKITEFEKAYRIIAPTCPVLPDAKMKKYSEALRTILDAENVDQVNVMGYSEWAASGAFANDLATSSSWAISRHLQLSYNVHIHWSARLSPQYPGILCA